MTAHMTVSPNTVRIVSVRVKDNAQSSTAAMRQEPIPQPSEPMQFRAIGLIRARYLPSEESLTKGSLQTDDGAAIEAVLLGRVMSLVKKHIDLEQEHLWVVYPRTRETEDVLHVQIVGVWEPETLQAPPESESKESGDAETPKAVRPKPPMRSSSDLKDGYFSIRGEVVFHSFDNDQVVVKIQQAPRANDTKPRTFKLLLRGKLGPKPLRHFWDLQVERQADRLVIREATCVGAMPTPKPFRRAPGSAPPRRFGGGGRPGGGGGRPGGGGRSYGGGGRSAGGERPFRPSGDRPERAPRPEPRADGERRPPLPRPVKNPNAGQAPAPQQNPPAAE